MSELVKVTDSCDVRGVACPECENISTVYLSMKSPTQTAYDRVENRFILYKDLVCTYCNEQFRFEWYLS